MKNVVKSMLVMVIGFSLVFSVGFFPVGSVWAVEGRLNIEVEVENAELRHAARKFEEEQKRAREHAEHEITVTRDRLAGHLNDVRNGVVFNGLIGDFFESLENDDNGYKSIRPKLERKVKLIIALSNRLKSLSESYERKYEEDDDYSWVTFQKDLELDEGGNPIIKVKYQDKERELDLSIFSSDASDEEGTTAAESEPDGHAHAKKVEAAEDESAGDGWNRVFGRDDSDDDDDDRPDRKKARESEIVEGCQIPQHDNQPTSGERVFGLGALTLFGIGASVLAGVNTSYLYKERKSLRHQMERASANGDSPFLYHGAYAALNYQNPLGGLGETLGPISMAISSILMGGDRGYMNQMEYLKSQRMRAILSAMAQARASTNVTQSSTRRIEIQRNLQGLDNIARNLFGDLNNIGDRIDGAFKNIGDQLTGGMSQAELNQTLKSINNMSQNLAILGGLRNTFDEFGDRIKKQAAEAIEAANNAQNAINSSGGFTQTFEQASNGRFSSSRSGSGLTTGPNGVLVAPGFPQTGGGSGFVGLQVNGRFGPR